MAAFDFSGLTLAQQELLTFSGWDAGSNGRKQPRPGTVKKLLERGLLVARTRPFMGITITVYDVPTPVHMAWCEHCAANEGAKA